MSKYLVSYTLRFTMVIACIFLGLAVFVNSGLAHFPLIALPGAYPGNGNQQQVYRSDENTMSTNENAASVSTGSQQGSSAGNSLLSRLFAYYSGNVGNYPGYGKFYALGHSGSASNQRQKQLVDFHREYYKTLGSSYRPFSPYDFYSISRFIYPGPINDVIRNNPFGSEEIITININLPSTQYPDKDLKVSTTNNKITNVNEATNIEKKEANNYNQNSQIFQQQGNNKLVALHENNPKQEHQNRQKNEHDDEAQKRLIAEKQKLKEKLQELQKQYNLRAKQQVEQATHQPENHPHHGHFQKTSIKKDSQSKKSSEENEASKKVKYSHQGKNGDHSRIEKNQLSEDQSDKSKKSEESNKEQLEKYKLQFNN